MQRMQCSVAFLILYSVCSNAMVADQRGPQAPSLIERSEAEREKDKTIFTAFDLDQSGFLEPNEMQEVIAKAGIDPSKFNWRNWDFDKDGRMSEEEFLQAGPSALSATFPKDQRIFRNGDADGSGFLEEGEMNKILSDAGIDPESFNWYAFDHDGDGRLSQEEFLESGPAAAEAARQENAPKRVFAALDADRNGVLNDQEIDVFMKDMNILPDHWNWRFFDTDGDGGLNEKEFIAAGPAIADASLVQEEPKRLFGEADHDQSNFLEPQEVDALIKHSGLHPAHFNWRSFDHDGDGRLNFAEFLQAAPAAASSPQEANSAQPQDRASPMTPFSPDEIFKRADEDGTGFLEAPEVDKLFQAAGIPSDFLNWRSFDHDRDSKLNLAEFYEVDQAIQRNPPPETQEQANTGAPANPDEVFQGTDKDGSGFLEAAEMDHLIQGAGIPSSIFNWRAFDHDGDGKLNKAEFYEADRAVLALPPPPGAPAQGAQPPGSQRSQSLEEQNSQSYEDQRKEFLEQTHSIFQEADSDGSNFLEAGEVEEFLRHMPVPKTYDWHEYDHDKDDRLSEDEFLYAGPAAVRAANARRQGDMEEEDWDEDSAGLLETDESDEDENDEPVTLGEVNFDEDEDEHEHGGKHEHNDEDEHEDEDENHHSAQLDTSDKHPVPDGTDDLQVYKDTDINKDGYCDASELARIEKIAGIKDVDWKKWDADKDGKLNKTEFLKYCQVAKDHASVQFKRHIMVETGEIDKATAKAGKVDPSQGWSETLPAENEKNSDVPAPLKAKGGSVAAAANAGPDGTVKSLMRAADQRQEKAKVETKANTALKKDMAKEGITAGKIDPYDSALQVSADAMLRTAQRHINS
eukprot:gnl/MRDRNA2_/MRDRNA2_91377_c0_seq1.p1 gnl/MRDRNA2_/MRDRNA2_91377_c0~~gnl/MRDRNA2_/MRDRNA2_91377_c0_seq1.p1  ORF type:complete len:857 (+),score=263.43 gnl/MRDRNA2_/MRDRNA2_91377_c0_seq1:110-2680(+)